LSEAKSELSLKGNRQRIGIGLNHDARRRRAIAGANMTEIHVMVRRAESGRDFDETRGLFREYGASLDVDLSFQGFEEEIALLPGKYVSPKGALFLASDAAGQAIGCVGVRPFDRPAACEMKRLYVRPAGRGRGAGRALAIEAIRFASAAGYREMLLDSLSTMEAAIGIYRSLGFAPIPPYWNNIVPGILYFGMLLSGRDV
jgi:ribosomal protein S18 acetylase RimI-like enzyme